MDLSLERDSTTIGSLFQQIVTDMKNTSPLWEDFVARASKLHACLRAAIQAIAAYLDTFQKIADAATNSKGASKEIGTALTRICLRHKAVETRMKTFTSAIMDCLIIPLQEKLEDWKRQVITLDKDHAKEYKRCRTELKKRSSDTLRLQKKARKGQSETIQSLVDSHMHDVTLRRVELEEVEKKSLRAAMIEERMRYCSFVNMLQPVVKEECEIMSELSHLQEAMDSIANVTKEPNILPQSSEELISESKYSINLYPESPGCGSGSQGCSNSLGSRKSSVCSISSMNSSGSSGSPSHHCQRSISQLNNPTIRLKPGESNDSGFCSSPALTSQVSTNTSQSHAVSTWPPHSQDAVQTTDRPHTISSAYEKGHQRPALTVYTFQNPGNYVELQKSPATTSCRPPLPVRCSSLERPLSSSSGKTRNVNFTQRQCPSPIPAHITKEISYYQPTYVNMSELASMAALKATNQYLQKQTVQQQQQLQIKLSSDCSSNPSQFSSSDVFYSTENQHQQSKISTTSVATTEGETPSNSNYDSLQLTTASLQNNSSQLTSLPKTALICSSVVGETTNLSSFQVKDELKITEADNNSTTISTTIALNTNTPPHPIITTTTTTTTTATTTTTTTSADNNSTTNTKTNTIDTSCFDNTTTTISTIKTANNSSNNEYCSSTDNIDDISVGSVLEKTSMFEKLEQKQQQQSSNNNHSGKNAYHSSSILSHVENIHSGDKDDNHKLLEKQQEQSQLQQRQEYQQLINNKDSVDKVYEDSIQELNNLIGELDSFQREHELKEQVNLFQLQEQHQELNNYQKSLLMQQNIKKSDNDKISIECSNYLLEQNISNTNYLKTTEIDSDITRYNLNTEVNPSEGFENPTFAHFNNNSTTIINESASNSRSNSFDDRTNFISYDNESSNFLTSDIDYLKKNSEVVVLRCKENSGIISSSISGRIDNDEDSKHRLSSFRCDQQLQQHPLLQQYQEQQKQEKKMIFEQQSSPNSSSQVNINTNNINVNASNLSSSSSSMKEFKANLDERLRSKPTISPRPASLSGCVTRIARRSSVNNTKPPPPVRRSSSVTSRHYLTMPNSPNLVQQNITNTSTESLPPPPAYLLDSRTNNVSSSANVSETVKALTVIRRTPASPGAIRKVQNQFIQNFNNQNKEINNITLTPVTLSVVLNDSSSSNLSHKTPQTNITHTSNRAYNSSFKTTNSTSSGIYAQPKQITKMSSFRTPSPGPQKANANLIAQLNARLTPNKQHLQNISSIEYNSNNTGVSSICNQNVYQQQQLTYSSSPPSDQIYAKTSDTYCYKSQQQQDQQHQPQKQQHQLHYNDYSSLSSEKSGSNKIKTKAEFLESLNVKLAKQGLSGKAFAVRNFINSRALSDPRLCHESLMDQIKRGATLKRNRTINDRSAPKIH